MINSTPLMICFQAKFVVVLLIQDADMEIQQKKTQLMQIQVSEIIKILYQ